ncbi:MAG: hypothetical protein HYY01_15095 [Chloroflexi bacterium]|nr:hypothetical protein [Chloroflexota bacterium]
MCPEETERRVPVYWLFNRIVRDEREQAAQSLLEVWSAKHVPDHEGDLNPSVLVMHVVGACALAAFEKERTQGAFTERFRELLDSAERALFLIQSHPSADDTDIDQVVAFQGMIDVERFRMRARDGEYEGALLVLDDGMQHIRQAVVTVGESGIDVGALQYARWAKLPLGNVDLGTLRLAAKCFDNLRAQPEVVKDWRRVATACRHLAANWELIEDLRDSTVCHLCGGTRCSHLVEGWESVEGVEFVDYGGISRTIGAFWTFAEGFAISRLSRDQYLELRAIQDQELATRVMQQMFFQETWERLPKLTQDALVQAEVVWWSRARSTKSAVVDNLWKATRQLVPERLVTPFGQYAASGPIKGFAELKAVSLLADGSQAPDLSDLMKVTWQAPQFPEFAKTLGLGTQEYQFLLSVESDLWRLINLRNKSMHPDKGETLEPHDIEWAYRTFLGVGCEGILPRLASLRASAPQARGH